MDEGVPREVEALRGFGDHQEGGTCQREGHHREKSEVYLDVAKQDIIEEKTSTWMRSMLTSGRRGGPCVMKEEACTKV